MYALRMIFATDETLLYYTSLVQTQRRDWFLAVMFLPIAIREAVLVIYSLDIELAHVHHVVKEEMMGHIRYAWWQEKIEGLYNSHVFDHPLLQTIVNTNIPSDILLTLVVQYQKNFPELPVEIENVVQNVVHNYLNDTILCSITSTNLKINQYKKWQKAGSIIARHRKIYGSRRDGWLLFKLLCI